MASSLPRLHSLAPDITEGDFRLKKMLGRGGMGEVWLAEQISLNRDVVLKFLPSFTLDQTELIERLKTEARSAARIHHANVISIYALTTFQSQTVVVMEYLPGNNLRQLCRKGKRFSLQEIFKLIEQVVRGLGAAYDVGVIHRDIKPSNLLISNEGHVKILDFGLARIQTDPSLTRTGTVLGTVHYMSPEQAVGDKSDIRSDFYSLGIIVYELINGFLPFRGSSPIEIARSHLEEPLLEMSSKKVPPPLSNMILKILDKDPKNRPANATEFLKLIDNTRQSCRGHFDLESQDYYSRNLELNLLEEAAQLLTHKHSFRWDPQKIKLPVLAIGLLSILALVFWPRSNPSQKLLLPLDKFPQKTRLFLNDKEISPPFPAHLTISPGAHQLIVKAPFHSEHVIPFTSTTVPSSQQIIPKVEETQVLRHLSSLLKKASKENVSLNFLYELYPKSAFPLSIQKLRKEITRLSIARKALNEERPEDAIKALEAIPLQDRHPVTRHMLELARIYLLPDTELHHILSELQNFIKRGEDLLAEKRIEDLKQIRPNLAALNQFERQVDQLRSLRKSAEYSLRNRLFQTLETTLKSWAHISPNDELLNAYHERWTFEKEKIILKKNEKRLLSDLETREQEWDPWIFFAHLNQLTNLDINDQIVKPFKVRNLKRLQEDLCTRLINCLKDPQSNHKLTGQLINELNYQTNELREIGWTWQNQNLTPIRLTESKSQIKFSLLYTAKGDFQGKTQMTSISHHLEIVAALPETKFSDHLVAPEIQIQKISKINP